jgi:hypothetical protein
VRAFDPQHSPQELRPAHVNIKKLFLTGSLGWLLVLAIVGVLHLTGISIDGRLALMCLAGLALGAAGYIWSHAIQQRHPEL